MLLKAPSYHDDTDTGLETRHSVSYGSCRTAAASTGPGVCISEGTIQLDAGGAGICGARCGRFIESGPVPLGGGDGGDGGWVC